MGAAGQAQQQHRGILKRGGDSLLDRAGGGAGLPDALRPMALELQVNALVSARCLPVSRLLWCSEQQPTEPT